MKRSILKKRILITNVAVMAFGILGGRSFGQNPDPAIPKILPTTEVRQSVCLNGMWDFTPDGQAATKIQVPATWDHSSEASFNFLNNFPTYSTTWAGGTYSHSLSVPTSMSGKVIKLSFNSVRFFAQVSVNGTLAVTDSDGFLPFECKVNNLLNGTNDAFTVKVGPNAVHPSGYGQDFGAHRGIWQDVYLKAYPLVYIDNAFFVKTSFRNNQIATDVPVRNEDAKSRTFYIRNFVTDASGAIVLTFDSDWQTLAAGTSHTYSFSGSWNNPHYWIPEDPYLYTIHTVIYDSDKSTVVDWKKTRFGFKEFYVSGTQFYLNGKKAFLRGDSHHMHSEYQQARSYFVALFSAMKSWGCNYFRPHTMPYDPALYEVADSLGMMLVAEAAVFGSDGDDSGYYPDHERRFVERDRNHPSIILWSSGNEVAHMGVSPEPNRAAAAQMDSTRIVYCEENGYCSPEICSVHYMDINHSGLYTAALPVPPIRDANKIHSMGEYIDPQITSFGDTGTGPCGYECKSQDYGTGYWKHGETAIGQTTALQNQRQYGQYCLWSTHWGALRCQPFFNETNKTLSWPDLTAPGIKPQVITPFEHTINWADPDLPLYTPLPWFYLYIPLYQAVRCTDLMPDWKTGFRPVNNRNYYSATTITRSFDLWYESFQNANHMKTEIVRKSDGTVLYTNDLTAAPWNNIQPGTTYRTQSVSWTAPSVSQQTPVHINRTFYMDTKAVNTCSYDGNIYPKFSSANLPGMTGRKVALFDPAGTTKAILDNIGMTYTAVTALSSVTSTAYDVLVIGSNNSTTGLSADFAAGGGRVLCLSQTTKPSLPINLPSLISGAKKDVQFLLNGAKHKIFDGLDQNDLSYWANNVTTAQNVYDRPTVPENIRVLVAADSDGDYAPILEVPAGKGTYLLSQMEIVPQYNNEPVAGQLLVNMLNYLGEYTPSVKAKTGLIVDAGAIKTYYDGLGLRYDALNSATLPDLTPYTLLIIDGTSTSIATSLSASANVTKLNTFVSGGGKVMIHQITGGTMTSYGQLMNQFSLTLSTPTEKTRCVKCAVSWLRKSSPMDVVRYGYLNIPNPFEMNPDDLLMGINNKDLDWTATELNNGIKASGKSYPDVNELVAPYRIDWATLKTAYDKYTSPSNRSKYQNTWMLNREPVLLKLKQGTGFWLINEILLQNDLVKGKRLGNLLLTSLGASVGSTDVYYNVEDGVTAIHPQAGDLNKGLAQGELKLLGVSAVTGAKTLRIAYTVPNDFRDIQKIVFAMYDLTGKQVWRETLTGGFHAGKNEMLCNGGKIRPSGIYLVRMIALHKNDGRRELFCRQFSIFQ